MTPKGSDAFNPVQLIRKKRDRETLTAEEIKWFVDQYAREDLPDYQMSAFLMAAFLNGLDDPEMYALTDAMLHSGTVVDLSEIPGTKVDKHSTGGVGDKLSLILVPIVAACGVPVPMISGRGLGHTGGTLDKLESIPGFTVDMELDRYKEILKKHRMVMAGASTNIAPADKKMYALRDVTATVESIPLIAGSIMSKKLAEGCDGLVLDVKFGAGAFMKKHEDAQRLAQTLVDIGERFGKRTIAYLTYMGQPLGNYVGNWLEMYESMEALHGRGPADVMEVTYRLTGTMVYLGGQADTIEEGIERSKKVVESGEAFEKWLELVEEQGGDPEVLRHPDQYDSASIQQPFKSTREGYVDELDAFAVGMAALELGAGRRSKEQQIDPASGIILHKKRGDFVKEGETLATFFTNKEVTIDIADSWMSKAYSFSEQQPESETMITHQVDREGVKPL